MLEKTDEISVQRKFQNEKKKLPPPKRLRGRRKLVLVLISKGVCTNFDLYASLANDSRSTVRTSIHALKKEYGLIVDDGSGGFALSELGGQYAEILEGASRGSTTLLPPDKSVDSVRESTVKVHAQANVQNDNKGTPVVRNCSLSFFSVSKCSDNRLPGQETKLLDPEPGADSASKIVSEAISQNVSQSGGRGSSFQTKIGSHKWDRRRVCTEVEKGLALTQYKSWRESGPPDGQITIFSKLLAVVLGEKSYYVVFHKNREAAARYFDLPLEEFDFAILKLKQDGIAYYREDRHERKTAFFVPFINGLLGRFD